MAGLVPRYVSIVETQPLSQGALIVKYAIAQAMSELGQHLLSLLTGFYEERQSPLPHHLVIQANGVGSYALVNQGAIVGLPSDHETLRAYQDEFIAFGESSRASGSRSPRQGNPGRDGYSAHFAAGPPSRSLRPEGR